MTPALNQNLFTRCRCQQKDLTHPHSPPSQPAETAGAQTHLSDNTCRHSSFNITRDSDRNLQPATPANMAQRTTLQEFEAVFSKLEADLVEHAESYKLPQKQIDWYKAVGCPLMGIISRQRHGRV